MTRSHNNRPATRASDKSGMDSDENPATTLLGERIRKHLEVGRRSKRQKHTHQEGADQKQATFKLPAITLFYDDCWRNISIDHGLCPNTIPIKVACSSDLPSSHPEYNRDFPYCTPKVYDEYLRTLVSKRANSQHNGSNRNARMFGERLSFAYGGEAYDPRSGLKETDLEDCIQFFQEYLSTEKHCIASSSMAAVTQDSSSSSSSSSSGTIPATTTTTADHQPYSVRRVVLDWDRTLTVIEGLPTCADANIPLDTVQDFRDMIELYFLTPEAQEAAEQERAARTGAGSGERGDGEKQENEQPEKPSSQRKQDKATGATVSIPRAVPTATALATLPTAHDMALYYFGGERRTALVKELLQLLICGCSCSDADAEAKAGSGTAVEVVVLTRNDRAAHADGRGLFSELLAGTGIGMKLASKIAVRYVGKQQSKYRWMHAKWGREEEMEAEEKGSTGEGDDEAATKAETARERESKVVEGGEMSPNVESAPPLRRHKRRRSLDMILDVVGSCMTEEGDGHGGTARGEHEGEGGSSQSQSHTISDLDISHIISAATGTGTSTDLDVDAITTPPASFTSPEHAVNKLTPNAASTSSDRAAGGVSFPAATSTSSAPVSAVSPSSVNNKKKKRCIDGLLDLDMTFNDLNANTKRPKLQRDLSPKSSQ